MNAYTSKLYNYIFKYINTFESYPSGKIRSFKPKIVFKEIRVYPTVIQ